MPAVQQQYDSYARSLSDSGTKFRTHDSSPSSRTNYSLNKPSKNANVAPRTVLNAAIKPLYVYAGKNAQHSVMENKDARWIPSVSCIGCECFNCDNRIHLLALQ